jgi:cytosine/adenosine deaminase-related metal-dependent hydrolase
MIDEGISVSIGADGAPCNNNLDGFLELRLAALLHKPRVGPRAMPAAAVLRLATMGGARALGLEAEIGSLEVGKKADVVVVDVDGVHVAPTENATSAVVYACRSTDVTHVVVDGRVVVRERELTTMDVGRVTAEAKARAATVFARMGAA